MRWPALGYKGPLGYTVIRLIDLVPLMGLYFPQPYVPVPFSSHSYHSAILIMSKSAARL